MDTEIVDYHGEAYSLHAFSHAPRSVMFSTHGNSSSSEHSSLQEMPVEFGVTNASVSDVSGPASQRISILMRCRGTNPTIEKFHSLRCLGLGLLVVSYVLIIYR
jgi:hypothetical protein